MAAPAAGAAAALAAARSGLASGIGLGDFLVPFQDDAQSRPASYPATDTGNLLKFAADILLVPSAIRALHIALPMEFDHHAQQAGKMTANFDAIDAALDAFLSDLATHGLAETTLVMTVSEFGRRVEENSDAGTDHGTASCLFCIGSAVNGGLHGTQPSLTELDGDGNLVATTPFTDVLASVAEQWLGATGVVSSTAQLNLLR
jgi:uncharacterized protein (DUF1501 family)